MKEDFNCKSLDPSQTNCNQTCFYWPAIIVAAIIGVGLSFLFTLLSLAFGFTAISYNPNGMGAFSVAGFCGLVLISIISMFGVGWLAGYLGRDYCTKKYYGELYGLTAWSLTLILTILLSGSVSKFIANTSYLVNKNATPISFTVTQVIPENHIINTTHEKNSDILATTTFSLFFIFLIGAISSCFGGRFAMFCNKSFRERYLR